MLLQKSESINPPLGFASPNWQLLSSRWKYSVERDGSEARRAVEQVATCKLVLGQDDNDTIDDSQPYDQKHAFGWDNENGVRQVTVPAHRISALPISNAEYLTFLESKGRSKELVPSSWTIPAREQSYAVRVVYAPGYVDFEVAADWPVQASARQLAAYAESVGGRLPTEYELRVYMQRNPTDRPGANIGFANWHPIPYVATRSAMHQLIVIVDPLCLEMTARANALAAIMAAFGSGRLRTLLHTKVIRLRHCTQDTL